MKVDRISFQKLSLFLFWDAQKTYEKIPKLEESKIGDLGRISGQLKYFGQNCTSAPAAKGLLPVIGSCDQ
jgi:hypothetical protein